MKKETEETTKVEETDDENKYKVCNKFSYKPVI